MIYDIYLVGKIEVGPLKDCMGIEIQPPIGRVALEGAVKRLLPTEGWNYDKHLVQGVTVTRDDTEGTAAIIERNSRNSDASAYKIALAVGQLIDPTGQHEIHIHQG